MWQYSFQRLLSIPILVIITLSNELAADESYAGCQVYSMTLASRDQARQLVELAAKEGMNIWHGPMVDGPTDVMVCEKNKAKLVSFAETNKIQADVIVEDVQQMVDKSPTFSKARSAGSISWDAYYDLETTYAWMASMASKYPDMAKVETIGKTVEGRDIRMFVVGKGSKGFHLQCVIHACEWTGGPVCTWAINEFTENSKNYKGILNNIKFYIVPVVNPDGYEYTKTKPLWERNKGKTGKCEGVNLNRNFPYEWQIHDGDGLLCPYDNGDNPGSEPETQAYIKHFSTHKDIQVFVDIHSYGQLVLHPWCFTEDKVPEDNEELTALGKKVADAIGAVHNNPYRSGNWPGLLYQARGVAIDWTYAVAKIKYSYTIELRKGPDSSNNRYRIDEKDIRPTVEECWAGIRVLIDTLMDAKGRQLNSVASLTFSWLLVIAAGLCSYGLI